jgi:hypothetical protein
MNGELILLTFTFTGTGRQLRRLIFEARPRIVRRNHFALVPYSLCGTLIYYAYRYY